MSALPVTIERLCGLLEGFGLKHSTKSLADRLGEAEDGTLTPRAFNDAYNDALIAMANSKHREEISDYFIRVTVNRSALNEQIENMPVLSKQTRINFEAVGTALTYRNSTGRIVNFRDIETWDESIYDQAALMVSAKLTDERLKDRILAEIEQGRLTEEMMVFVERLVNESRNEILYSINSQLRPGGIIGTRTEPILNLDAPMQVISKPLPENTYADGYKNENGMWVPQPTTENYNGYAIITLTPGTYVFAGRTVNIPGIEEVPRGGHISEFTARYGLEDYLGYDGVDLNQNATRLMVAGSVARIAGAPKTADPIVWISSNLNVQLSSRNSGGLVQTQEAVAMVMALYEKKTNTQISGMVIRNYQITANMTGLDDRYDQAMRAAFETGILTDTAIRPANPVTIRMLLDMLGALNGKVKL